MRFLCLSLAIATTTMACRPAVTANADTTTTSVPYGCLTSITVSPPTVSVLVGDVYTLAVNGSGCGKQSAPTFRWSSSNSALASVDSISGSVHALVVGDVTIIAAATDDPNVKGAALVRVVPR